MMSTKNKFHLLKGDEYFFYLAFFFFLDIQPINQPFLLFKMPTNLYDKLSWHNIRDLGWDLYLKLPFNGVGGLINYITH